MSRTSWKVFGTAAKGLDLSEDYTLHWIEDDLFISPLGREYETHRAAFLTRLACLHSLVVR